MVFFFSFNRTRWHFPNVSFDRQAFRSIDRCEQPPLKIQCRNIFILPSTARTWKNYAIESDNTHQSISIWKYIWARRYHLVRFSYRQGDWHCSIVGIVCMISHCQCVSSHRASICFLLRFFFFVFFISLSLLLQSSLQSRRMNYCRSFHIFAALHGESSSVKL